MHIFGQSILNWIGVQVQISLKRKNMNISDVNVFKCSSCGKDHILSFIPYNPPLVIDDEIWTHYFICPETQEVVSVKEHKEEEK